MPKYKVAVAVHRQSNRCWQTTVEVEATTAEQAAFKAEDEAQEQAGSVDFNEFSEESVHYEAEAQNVTSLETEEPS